MTVRKETVIFFEDFGVDGGEYNDADILHQKGTAADVYWFDMDDDIMWLNWEPPEGLVAIEPMEVLEPELTLHDLIILKLNEEEIFRGFVTCWEHFSELRISARWEPELDDWFRKSTLK